MVQSTFFQLQGYEDLGIGLNNIVLNQAQYEYSIMGFKRALFHLSSLQTIWDVTLQVKPKCSLQLVLQKTKLTAFKLILRSSYCFGIWQFTCQLTQQVFIITISCSQLHNWSFCIPSDQEFALPARRCGMDRFWVRQHECETKSSISCHCQAHNDTLHSKFLNYWTM